MHPMLTMAVRAAHSAGDLIMRAYERLDTVRVSQKGHNDFVTEVDKAAEKEIIYILHKAFPEHSVLAEESGHTAGNDFQWVIDPLDGTTNFIHGLPHFAVSIALLHKNRVVQAVIYDPVRQELFTASRGQGAQLNGRRLRISTTKELEQALIGTSLPSRNLDNITPSLAVCDKLLRCTAGVRRLGSAALDLAYIAAGRLDGYWEFGLNPWDIAAGSLLVKEAGGLIGDVDGSENHMQTGNILAGSPRIFKAMLPILAGGTN